MFYTVYVSVFIHSRLEKCLSSWDYYVTPKHTHLSISSLTSFLSSNIKIKITVA